MGEQLNQILIEAEIFQAARDLAAFYEECAVARHAGHDLLVRIDLPDVPQARHENAAVDGSDHLLDRCIAARDHNVRGRFAKFIWQRKTVPGRLDAGTHGRLTAVDHVTDHAPVDQRQSLAWDAFSVEWRSGLKGMA